MVPVHHRYAVIGGHRVFYREAGGLDRPTVVLLHGFPTSSTMFRNLLPVLAERWHVVAPDLLGFGLSDAPPPGEFPYSFDSLADVTSALLGELGIERYALFVHDYGAPIGWRLALRAPDAVRAIVSQSGNAYNEGFQPEFFVPMREYWQNPGPAAEQAVRDTLTPEVIRWLYLSGAPDETLIDPSLWVHDHDLLARPGNDLIQLALFSDYASNLTLYRTVQRYFRSTQVPLLAVWGRNDPVFGPAGALAFTTDLPTADVHLLDGGHFLLETALGDVASLVTDFFDKHL
ncbi:alpha/beta fold hydrolase [Herbiconiux sp. VKM Ac-2851]|uniref:alpha/beta fold hydrolase n=1 Tax=Herbiconiux sp. VKM Ac-2851 TaxID=2739025 RepID=UPI0015635E42|nr:alpha/beta hydrolase [Herbiconiux sp. VKM Ac-2851]NQX34082.1 alpha/beta hydrolase [Herbiconiux sp. VKM Ac-2851]